MSDYAIVQTIRVGRSNRLIVRGYVRDVPKDQRVSDVEDALTAAGHAPLEAGILWANHVVREVSRLGEHETAPVVTELSWADVQDPKPRQLNVRVSPALYAAVEAASRAAGQSLREWCEEAITAKLGR